MFWFISACLFLILSHYIRDFGSTVSLGLFFPIYYIGKKFSTHSQYRAQREAGKDFLFPLLFFLAISFPLGAMPQEAIDLTGLFLLLYLVHSLDDGEEKIGPLYSLFLSIVSCIFIWATQGKFVEIFFLSLCWGFFRSSFPLLASLSLAIHGLLGIVLVAGGYIHLFSASIWEFSRENMVFGGNADFGGFLPLGFAFFSLVSLVRASYYEPKRLIGGVLVLGVGYIYCFFTGNPYFSAFLYFSSLQGKSYQETIVERA